MPVTFDFSCHVCGKECNSAPPPPERTVCEEHCEDHEYERCLDRGWHHCIHCDKPVDPDWYYCDDDITGIG